MADTEDDLLKQAIAGTEIEIFSEAVGKDLPSEEGGPGDRSVEEMGEGLEGQREGADEETEVEAKGEGEDEGGGDEEGEQPEGDTEGDGKNKDRNPDGTFKAKDDDAAKETKVEAKTEEADGKPKPNRVPVGELVAERKARQEAETRATNAEKALADAKAASANEIAAINRRLDDLIAGRQAQTPKAEQADQPAKKDIFEDPDGFIADVVQNVERSVTMKFVAADLARTHEQHGEKFEKAYSALTGLDKNDPAARATVQRIWNSATPGSDLMKWYGRQEVQRVVGDDPEAYRQRVETEMREKLAKDPEFRKQLVQEMRGEVPVGEDGKPKSVVRMPRSLNGAAGGQGGGAARVAPVDGSDRGVFEDAFR